MNNKLSTFTQGCVVVKLGVLQNLRVSLIEELHISKFAAASVYDTMERNKSKIQSFKCC